MPIVILVLLIAFSSPVFAQTPEEAVKATNQAIMAAGLRGDQQAFAALVDDELQWVRASGAVLGKAEAATPLTP